MSKTEIAPVTALPSADNSKKRKLKAILAGGLVLGIGAAVTLAAWNDSEFAFGDFRSGKFNVQSSVDGTTFTDHSSAEAADRADLDFSANYDNMSPNDIVAAPYALRLEESTTYRGSLEVESVTAGGLAAPHLSYRIIKVNSFADCSATATGAVIASGPQLDARANVTPVFLAKPEKLEGNDNPGEITNLCIQVTAGDDLPQGTAANATWKFVATSVS
ncbi:SipW-dependent-type signal peptide-containing protein [Arthrobacter sp. FW305-BF8]|uniref:SipW-dependent-type signal peptide-containing protein n=1 Tax=Arthrobacter sp. FW305-BF8 TaxID=2879617 RepID=UPI001F36AB97|nr:SipW-dependent-type signal peptide-containing protein [Arthrobacter sp. FW305-BF8]UKA53369.1 SipW-dependent-type signal peptide-containing protein [Arthrobacter sp. FW305-BF8]